ncbi:hypothetical protein BDZ89DRAFT_1065749 [Hymenopellis radicata]|nr:hypothetical protein BDZ89DRAFT_1065749 [Hymenopellis radicata]
MLSIKASITGISLDAAGLVALADLSTISKRTALTGSASVFDILLLAPGIHTQQQASNVNGGELPATGAMTSGYVFRIENQATVYYLQGIGSPGCLVTVYVSQNSDSRLRDAFSLPEMLYMLPIALTLTSLALLGALHDYWAIGVLLMLIFARFVNMVIIKRRTQMGWKGVKEPGVVGDLLVLLSQDRWIRVRGLVDDLKVVASGQWLRDETTIEGFASAFATLVVYATAALASNASTLGSLVIALLLLVSVALLVHVVGEPKKYTRRLDMAKELIEETGRNDWAVSMGLVLPGESVGPSKVTL